MACNKTSDTSIAQIAVPFWGERLSKCNACEHAYGDTCTIVELKHPGQSSIKEGVKRPELRCPLPEPAWTEHPTTCPLCRRPRQIIPVNEMRCKWCKIKGRVNPLAGKRKEPVLTQYKFAVDSRWVSLNVGALTKPIEINRTSDLAIVTMVIGDEAEELAKFTLPRLEAYAKRCGADLHVIRENRCPDYVLANKFQTYTIATQYARTAFIDVDAYVTESCPNIFEEFSSGTYWTHLDAPFNSDIQNEVRKELIEIGERFGTPIDPMRCQCRNSGVVVMDKAHAETWHPPTEILNTHCGEQSWIEHQLLSSGTPLSDLPSEWNVQWWWESFDRHRDTAKIVHLAACPHTTRIQILKELTGQSSTRTLRTPQINCSICRRTGTYHESPAICVYCKNKKAVGVTVKKHDAPRSSFAYSPDAEHRFLKIADLCNDASSLVAQIPPDIVAIVGVARSGITPASMLAMLLHLPMFAIRQTLGDVISVGNGWRLGGNKHIEPPKGRVLIVDDTVMSGNSLRAIEAVVKKHFPQSMTASVYVNPAAKRKPDIWAVDLPWPHILEWNVFNSVLSPNMACDFDGILCHDCKIQDDDDGPRYLNFIQNARPLYTPRKVPIPLIVTARIEKYRQVTEQWLKWQGIRCNQLIMHPATTLRERRRDDIAAWKAKQFGQWAKHHKPRPAPLAFIESEDAQAKRIHELTGLLTICPATAKVYR